uniref:Retrovirus-related Pol polyprotein from transposon TNT 1-94 n=1 Tax=Tanacetum cinerariifolium TaxID=118510 RepID=A0A699GS25_TANCI|nr:retrovirus-related Pol polyprotein from transposon TNT 1-94 [Tanacetum cinerariifolium]
MRLRFFYFSLRDQASNWLERLPAGSIFTWEDLTTYFLARFFPIERISKLLNDILIFQQRQGIAEDVVIAIAGYVYLVDFVILYTEEDENKPFILGTPFLTITKVEIRFDKGIITLKSGRNKINFFKISTSPCTIEKKNKEDIDPITPINIVSRRILEWEERIKLHQEKEMGFNQWRSKVFDDKFSLLVNERYDYSLSIGIFFVQDKMSRDVITVGTTMRILLLYRGEYSQWREQFMNYLEEKTDGEAMINSIQNGDQPLPVVAQVSLAGTTQNAPPTFKDLKFWTAEEKKTRKIDHLVRSLLIQGLMNDIYSLIDSNETAKDLCDALERQMRGFEYGEQDRKAAILYEYKPFKATEGERLLDTYLRYLQLINDLKKCGYKKDNCELNYKFLNNVQPEWKQYGTLMRQTKNLIDINIDALYNILKQNQSDVNDSLGYKKKDVVITSDPLALVAEKTKYANKKQEFVKSYDKKVKKKDDEKRRDMSKVKCYNSKKEGHFAKDCKKAKVKDYNYYKTKMLLAKKDSDEQVLFAEDQAWMESSSDSDQEINANMVFMAQIKEVLSYSDESSSSAEETIAEVAYYTSESESESEYETSEYYDNSTNYGSFVNDNDDQKNFHDAIESASENFIENHIDSQKDYDKSEVDHNDSKEKEHLVDKLIQKFNHKIAKCQKRIEKANQQTKDSENQNKDLQDKYDVLINQVNTFEEQNNEFNEQMKIVQIYLWIIDSGCSKHMTGNRALLTNFVEKFIGTVRFGDNDFAVIAGYGDVVIGSMTIKKFYYVKGLGHNLFSVGQHCDKGLEVAFRKSTCFDRNEDGVDLPTGDRSSNLYTIALNEVASNSSTCLLAKASSS